MAPRKKLDPTLLAQAVSGVATQVISKGTPRTDDPKFPVFETPVNQDILVYIPRVSVVEGENGEEMRTLRSWLHDIRNGKQYMQLRSIKGLTADMSPAYAELGYDGECPLDEATKEEWELYNIKYPQAVAAAGLSMEDSDELLKPIRTRVLDERTIRNAEEYITFPVCIIPRKESNKPNEKMFPADNALEGVKVVFVTWKYSRYEKSLLSELEVLADAPSHPAGQYFLWKFTYDAKGKQHNARDSAKEAKYSVIQQAAPLAKLNEIREELEEMAKEFTPEKAAEVIVCNQFWYKEDLQAEVDKFMQKTRMMLRQAQSSSDAPSLNPGAPAGGTAAIGTGAGNPLANFSAGGDATAAGAGASTGISISADEGDLGVADGNGEGGPVAL